MSAGDRMRDAEEALRKVQAQAAALEELSEQLSLSVHVLEGEVAALAEQARSAYDQSEIASAGGAGVASTPSHAPARRSASAAETAPNEPARSSDVDGARLVALNMALEGEQREAVGRYLEERFDFAEVERLLDEVYAAVNA